MNHNQPLPHDSDLEKSILAACLIDRQSCDQAVSLLDVKDFYRKAHSVTFQVIIDLNAEGVPVSLVSVAERLIETKRLHFATGHYLASLLDFPMAVSIPYAAEKLKELSLRRRLIWGANKTMMAAYSAPIDNVYHIAEVIPNILEKHVRKNESTGPRTWKMYESEIATTA